MHHPDPVVSQEDLLLLLLGAAVQSEHKQDIVIGIKNLPLDTQHGIVDRIRWRGGDSVGLAS